MTKTIFLILFFIPCLVYCQDGKSLLLNGCTDFLEVEENDALDFDKELTIEFWIRPNCTEGNSIILGKEWCRGNFSYYASVAEGNIRWSIQSNGGCNPAHYFDTENNLIQAGEFSHVAIVHSQIDLKIYINGQRVPLNMDKGTFSEIYNSAEPFRIGAYKNIDESISNFYSGLIDEVRFWNIALTEQLIQSRYQTVLNGDESNLILYYQFEQNEIGSQLVIPNFGEGQNSQLNAIAKGVTSTSPYCIEPMEYVNTSLLSDSIYSICGVDSVEVNINSQADYKSILWSTGESTASIWIDEIGEYSVNIETERCNYSESVFEVQNLGITDTIELEVCPNNFVEFKGEEIYPNDIKEFISPSSMGCDTILIVSGILIETQDEISENYIQSCDDTVIIQTNLSDIKVNSNAIDSPIEIIESGSYFIEGVDNKGCLIKDTIEVEFFQEKVYFPNTIDPSSTLNNCFRPFFADNNNINYELKIYDRWGELIYDYVGNNACWDGTFNSNLVTQGVYAYMINYNSDCLMERNHSGFVTVVR